jgi:putative protease
MKKPELLIPAANLEVLKTAVRYGADAVYIGGDAFSLRAKADNFSLEDMKEGIEYAHAHGVKVHVTVNILAHDYDIDAVKKYLLQLRDLGAACGHDEGAAIQNGCETGPEDAIGSGPNVDTGSAPENAIRPDALIIADPGIFALAREICPEIDIHISTQANNTNYETYLFWHRLGAKRVVSARELSLKEIADIRAHIPDDLEIESFIHGAMCISYSGRCLLSNYFTGRDANQGACTHPCRWKYAVVEETRPGEYLPVYENERGTYIFNSKDLCMIDHIPEMIDAGIDSFKIEGRMKTALYVATVARTYRAAIDDYLTDPALYASNLEHYREEIRKCTYRQFTTGFYFGKPTHETQIYDSNTYVNEYVYLGTVKEVTDDGFALFEQKNKFCVGDTIEIMKKSLHNIEIEVLKMRTAEGEEVDSCPHSRQMIYALFSETPEAGDIIRQKGQA